MLTNWLSEFFKKNFSMFIFCKLTFMVFFFNQFDFQIVIREAFYRKKIVVGEASEVFNGIDQVVGALNEVNYLTVM